MILRGGLWFTRTEATPCPEAWAQSLLGSGWWVGKHLRLLCFSFFPFLLSGSPLASSRAHAAGVWVALTHVPGLFRQCLLGTRSGESPSRQVSVAVPGCARWTRGCFPGLCSGTGRGTRLLQKMTEALVSVDFNIIVGRSAGHVGPL